jgi:cephalosporin-C deacetylase-like acetyl esterase
MTTRRTFLVANLIGAAGLATNPSGMLAASDTASSAPAIDVPARSDRNFWADWPDLLTAEMNEARGRRMANLASLQSTAQLRERASFVRTKLWELLGGPLEKTPLNPKITGTLDRGDYRIEKLIFESMPEIYVTANLYLPSAGKPPYPAILAPVGHSDNGKEYHYYQHLYQNLARKGYVVLTYDPFGQGERLQYINPKTGRSLYGPTGEHSQAGRPMVLFGETLALYLAWDGIRGVDYLLTRPEVDPARIGCTGQSGGGTMTMYLAALEPRIRAAVVSDGNSENVAGPFFDPPGATDDAEQNIVGSLPLGMDRGDLLSAFAPKPLLICYTTHDEGTTYSPVYEESTQGIYEELQRVYGILGEKNRVGLYASHLPHSLNHFNRTQIYAWFNRWLDNPTAGTEEKPLDIFPEELLNATSTGQVLTSLGGRSVVQLNTDRARVAMRKSQFAKGSMADPTFRDKARDDLTALLALPRKRTPLLPRTRSSGRRENVVIEEIQFEPQPGIRIPGWFVAPYSATRRRFSTVLYLTDEGGDGVVAEPGMLDGLLAAGYAVCAVSLRGLGITLPRFPSGGPVYYDADVRLAERLAWTCLVLGRPIIGQRVWDTLRAVDYLTGRPDVDPSQIRILGTGSAGLAALMAAFLDDRLRAIFLDRTLVSYASIVESEQYSLKLAWFAPGILSRFDLPQIAAGLNARPCWILNSVGPNGQAIPEPALREQFNRGNTQETVAHNGLRLLTAPKTDAGKMYLEWLRST